MSNSIIVWENITNQRSYDFGTLEIRMELCGLNIDSLILILRIGSIRWFPRQLLIGLSTVFFMKLPSWYFKYGYGVDQEGNCMWPFLRILVNFCAFSTLGVELECALKIDSWWLKCSVTTNQIWLKCDKFPCQLLS